MSGVLLSSHSHRFASLQELEAVLPVHRVQSSDVLRRSCDVKAFSYVDLLVDLLRDGAPASVAAGGDLSGALQKFGNRSSVAPYEHALWRKAGEEVQYGRSFVFFFPVAAAAEIPLLRLSPVDMVETVQSPVHRRPLLPLSFFPALPPTPPLHLCRPVISAASFGASSGAFCISMPLSIARGRSLCCGAALHS